MTFDPPETQTVEVEPEHISETFVIDNAINEALERGRLGLLLGDKAQTAWPNSDNDHFGG